MACPDALALTGTPLASTEPLKIFPFKSDNVKLPPPSIASRQPSPSLSLSLELIIPSPSRSSVHNKTPLPSPEMLVGPITF